MRKGIVCFIFALYSFNAIVIAQNVSINETGQAPSSSAMLDISSTTKGLLIPRMTLSDRLAIVSPAEGLMVYQTDNDQGMYTYVSSTWSSVSYENELNLDKVLDLVNDANGDTIYNLGALSIGNTTIPKSSLVIDSFLTVQGVGYQNFRWYGFNTYVDNSNNLRYLHDNIAGMLGFGVDKTIVGHWESGTADALLSNDANSSINLTNSLISLEGTASNFKIDLRGIVDADSLIINNLYSLPSDLGSSGNVLTSDGLGKATWAAPVSGDNLGSHSASQNIRLNGNYLSNDGDNEGIHVAANGNVTVGGNNGFRQFGVWNTSIQAEVSLFSTVSSSVLSMGAHGTSTTNKIEAFRARGVWPSNTSVVAGDDIFTINAQPYNGGSSFVTRAFNISVDGVSSGNIATRISLFTRNLSNTNTERLTILGNGNVGISNTNPSEPLDVVGNVRLTGEVLTSKNGAANMIPIAYGNVNPGGSLTAGSNNVSVIQTSTGVYEISITGETYSNDAFITNVSIVGSTYGFIHTDVASGNLVVMTKQVDQSPTDIQFHFTVFKP